MTLVTMSGGEDWFFRPVVRNLCSYESLKNGALDLYDIVLLNEALDVFDENQRRLSKVRNG